MGSCEAERVAAPRKLWFVLCAALTSAAASCVGGPTSDYPNAADDDKDDDADDDHTESPPGQMDAGAGSALDAAAARDAAAPSRDASDAGEVADDAGDGGRVTDASGALDGAPRSL